MTGKLWIRKSSGEWFHLGTQDQDELQLQIDTMRHMARLFDHFQTRDAYNAWYIEWNAA